MSYRIAIVAALVGMAGLLLPGAGAGKPAQNRLIATVGGGTDGNAFTISLSDESGSRVGRLDPGTYTIEFRDLATLHNFHLRGPGVDIRTGVDAVETVTRTVTISEGTYTYVCDVHPTMRGSFTSGSAQPPPPPPPAPSTVRRLTGTVGPGYTISLRSGARRVTRVRAGLVRITVRDRSAQHNFHLFGPGVNKRTGVRARGTVTWRVRLRKGRTYRYVCDPHRRIMRGSFRAT